MGKNVIISLLFALTVFLIGLSIFIVIQISRQPIQVTPTPTVTPTITVTITTTPTETVEPTDTSVAGGPSICGETCNVDSDCATSTGGAPVRCRAVNGIKRCVNTNCPNNTVPGTICQCNNQVNCGQPCGKNQLPLCNPLGTETQPPSECGFIGGTNNCSESTPNNQYCLPKTFPGSFERKRCSGIAAWALYVKGGGAATTQAQVIQACAQAMVTPTVISTPGVAQCKDGVDNDGDGKVDCGANPDPGCFPDGQGGGGACNPDDNSERDALPDTALSQEDTEKIALSIILIITAIILIRINYLEKIKDFMLMMKGGYHSFHYKFISDEPKREKRKKDLEDKIRDI